MVNDLVVVHQNQDSRVTSVRPCFGFATADDIRIFFPADSHLHFPVHSVVSRPFQRKATRDSICLMLYSAFIRTVSKENL